MGVYVAMVVSCDAGEARAAVRKVSPGLQKSVVHNRVTAVGEEAARVSTHFRFPGSETSDEWKEIAAYVRPLAKLAGHEDSRGVLVFPDDLEVSARSYERFVTLTGSDAYWLKGKGRPVRSANTPAASKRRSTPAAMPEPRRLAESTKLACFVFPRAGKVAGHASVAALGSLADGTALVVVRELFSDPESLLRYVVEYRRIATLATDPRGLLAIPAKAYAAASRAASYDELVAKHASKRSKPPGHYWLKVSDLDALKVVLDGARDDAWDRSHGVTRAKNP